MRRGVGHGQASGDDTVDVADDVGPARGRIRCAGCRMMCAPKVRSTRSTLQSATSRVPDRNCELGKVVISFLMCSRGNR